MISRYPGLQLCNPCDSVQQRRSTKSNIVGLQLLPGLTSKMSSTPVLGFIKDISAQNVKAVKDRLKTAPQQQSANQRYTDPKEQNLTYTLLHKSVDVGCYDIVVALLAAGADVNAADNRGRTALHWLAGCSSEAHLSIAELLLKQPGINIHSNSNCNATPLHEAAAQGNVPVLKLLLKHGANPNINSPGPTALHAACCGSCDSSAPLSNPTAGSCQAQHQQQSKEQQQDQDLPAHQQAKPSSAQGDMKQPKAPLQNEKLHQAGKPQPKAEIRKVLSKHSTKSGSEVAAPAPAVSSSPRAAAVPLSGATPQGRMGVVTELLHAAPEVQGQQDPEGFTPLMQLLQRGLWAEARMLLGRADCNLQACSVATGDTALHIICSSLCPDLQLVSDLVAAGADAHAGRILDGNTPLLLALKAASQQGVELVKALLLPSKPSQQQQQQHSGSPWCPLDGEATTVDPPTKQGTRSTGSDNQGIDAANAAGETALGIAVAALGTAAGKAAGEAQAALALVLGQRPAISPQLASSLLQQGFNGQISDDLMAQVVACLPSAAAMESAVAAAASSATCKVVLPLNFHALLAAKLYKTAVAYKILATNKHPATDVDAAGNTLLHQAVSGPEDAPELVYALLAAGVPVNASNKEHDTALHIAARQGHIEACRVLVTGGAAVLRRNGKNRTPGNQLKLPEVTKQYMKEAEEAALVAKEEQRHALWDDKMRATQTESAFGIRVT